MWYRDVTYTYLCIRDEILVPSQQLNMVTVLNLEVISTNFIPRSVPKQKVLAETKYNTYLSVASV